MEPILLSGSCGAYRTNYDAEVVAIQKTIVIILQLLSDGKLEAKDIVIFSGSQSAIRAVENWQVGVAKRIESII